MTLKDLWDLQLSNSTKTSESIRQLSLRGIAMIWIFRNDAKTEVVVEDILPFNLIVAGILLALSLFMDVLQYFITAYKFRSLAEETVEKLNKGGVDPAKHYKQTVALPTGFHDIAKSLYYLKFVCAVVAYVFIIIQVSTLLVNTK